MTHVIEVRPRTPLRLEVVERKGIGHPDTICDAIAEEVSIALATFELEHCGRVLHHNVDKVLLRGGRAAPRFGGGRVTAPIELYLGGRATAVSAAVQVPVDDLATQAARSWLATHVRHLDVARDVVIHPLIRAGSAELVELLGHEAPRANDSSIGIGFAPRSPVEQLVLDVDAAIRAAREPAFGEDLKLLAVRDGDAITLTIACALVDRHVADAAACRAHKATLHDLAVTIARARWPGPVTVHVNRADDAPGARPYLTVTGTSAECGDDGEVGRGNRVGGLITPGRPMTMEAAAGKNPINHVGKLYNVAAHRLAATLCDTIEAVTAAQVFLVSEIGRRLDDPHVVHVELALADDAHLTDVRPAVDAAVDAALAATGSLWRDLLARRVRLF